LPDPDALRAELAGLDHGLRTELAELGFDPEQLIGWSRTVDEGVGRNRVAGVVEPPAPGDVALPAAGGSDEGRRLTSRGLEALAAGEVAFVVMAGGMATRMGGVVKALAEPLPGHTFLDLRVRERAYWERQAAAVVPLWIIGEALGTGLEDPGLGVFRQRASLRLTPEGRLFRDASGAPSVHATGHGDMPEALRASGLLGRFIAAGGRYVWVANLDNLGAGIDPLLLGWHIEQGRQLTVEVADAGSDKGGLPVRWNGRPVVLEDFRLPDGFDRSQVPVFNTNTLLVDADALAGVDMAWTYFTVEKEVDGRPAIQFERLVGELTSSLVAGFVRVPRTGPRSRFLPVKDDAELARRRSQIALRVAQFLD
jgi:UTP--glucose-1-phosphate uridylyltransferase